MNTAFSIPIEAWAIAGPGGEHAPEAQRLELPPPGTKRKGGRLPLLAAALARQATDTPHPSAAVLFGTALGCLTETELFVNHMIEAEEATPKPRAFSSSVHNAIASKVAMDLRALGACQTFVHGEVSFAHALLAGCLLATDSDAPVYVGALDEKSEYADRGLRSCGFTHSLDEGGAVVRLGSEAAARARITEVWLGRHTYPPHRTGGSSIVAIPGIDGEYPPTDGVAASFSGIHPSLLASATALAAGIVAGTVAPSALGLEDATRDITLVARSRFDDLARIRVSA